MQFSLGQILELIYYWSQDLPIKTVSDLTGRSNATIVDWFNLCRDVCCSLFEKREKMGGQNIVVQIDNRGRLLLGDLRHEQVQDNSADFHSDSAQENQINLANSPTSNRNYGRRLEGPWRPNMKLKKLARRSWHAPWMSQNMDMYLIRTP
ncbi:hypothetical protein ACI65C_003738 [Semiaphis heraclei]